MTSYTKGSTSISYSYDASGLRASKTVNGGTTIYQYVGDKLYFEQRADGSKMYYFYDSYGTLTYIYHHVGNVKTAYNVVTNSQGDVIALYNWNGNQLVASYEYDAWGNCTITQDTTGIGAINPIRYRGYYYDSEIGLYYLQSRYYDPNTGRFLNADTTDILTQTIGTLHSGNLFAYCSNNPIMNVDPTGFSDKTMEDSGIVVFLPLIILVIVVSVVVFLAEAIVYILKSWIIPAIQRLKAEIKKLLNIGITKALSDVLELAKSKADNKGRTLRTDKHHIVAKSDHRAEISRAVLDAVEIDINSNHNLVTLNKELHSFVHTTAYHEAVEDYLITAYMNENSFSKHANVLFALLVLKVELSIL